MEPITIDSSSVLSSNPITGAVTVIKPIRVGGVTLGNNVILSGAVMIGDTSIGSLINKRLEATVGENGVFIITGYHG